jgi:urease accessory protein
MPSSPRRVPPSSTAAPASSRGSSSGSASQRPACWSGSRSRPSCFRGARVASLTEIALSGDARVIGWEILSLGRPVIGERFVQGALDATLRVSRNGSPLLLDRLRVDGPQDLDRPSGLTGHAVSATFVASGAEAGDLEAALAVLAGAPGLLAGVTLQGDLLVVRALADTTEPAQRVFCALWTALRPRLIGREALPPRIWAT